MPKLFYKKTRPRKLFYAPGLKYPSTAYGEAVLRSYANWRQFFYARWNTKTENLLLSEQGDISGCSVRAAAQGRLSYQLSQGRGAVVRDAVSVLPPLWKDDLLLEAEKMGYLVLNGKRTPHLLGAELKAWALIASEDRGGDNRLYVIGKRVGSSQFFLTESLLRAGGALEPISAFPLPETVEEKSTLIAFGRHLFVVHDARLTYLYLAPETEALEQVLLGGEEDAPWLRRAESSIVCDERGNVFWKAEDGIYTFRIGYPAAVKKMQVPDKFRLEHLCCRGGYLFADGTDRDGRVQLVYRDGEAPCATMRGRADLILSCVNGEPEIAAMEQRMGRTYANVFVRSGGAAKTVAQIETGGKNSLFCYFGELYPDARYVGRAGNNVILLKR